MLESLQKHSSIPNTHLLVPGPEDPLKVESLIHLASEQPEAANDRPRLEVSILRADDLLLHHVLDNAQRLFAWTM